MKGFTTTLRSMTAPPKTLEPRTRFHVDRAEHAWPRDAGHATRTYMSALPYREANRSQSADRSDSVLKIEHRYGTSRIVTFIPNPTMVLASATEWGSGSGRTGLAGTLPSKMPRLGRIGFALAAITRANGVGAIGWSNGWSGYSSAPQNCGSPCHSISGSVRTSQNGCEKSPYWAGPASTSQWRGLGQCHQPSP